MSTTDQILNDHPNDRPGLSQALLSACIDACIACAQACTSCADACLGDLMVDQLRGCISADLDCADICTSTARVLSRQVGHDASLTRVLVLACLTACRAAHIRHYAIEDVDDRCRVCVDACRVAEHACRELLNSLE